jgi:hypothetical protein
MRLELLDAYPNLLNAHTKYGALRMCCSTRLYDKIDHLLPYFEWALSNSRHIFNAHRANVKDTHQDAVLVVGQELNKDIENLAKERRIFRVRMGHGQNL